jgi:hypothetical protein
MSVIEFPENNLPELARRGLALVAKDRGVLSEPHNPTQAVPLFTPDTLCGEEIAKAVELGEVVADGRLLELWDFYANLAEAKNHSSRFSADTLQRFAEVRDLLLELVGRRAKERISE